MWIERNTIIYNSKDKIKFFLEYLKINSGIIKVINIKKLKNLLVIV